MKKLATLGSAATATLVAAAVAFAQTPPPPPNVAVAGQLSPTKGGTKKKPKNADVGFAFTVNPQSRKTVSTIELFVPKNIRLDGTGFKTCTAEEITVAGSPDDCPSGSKLGEGTASAALGPALSPLEITTETYVAGKNEIALYLRGNGNAVSIALPGKITSESGDYGQKISVDIPPQVQQPLAGAYSYITSVDTSVNGKVKTGKGKKRKTRYFASLRGCTGGEHEFGVNLVYVQNDAGPAGETGVSEDTVACSK